MSGKEPALLKQLTPFRILLIILFGLAIVGYLILKDFDKGQLDQLSWSWSATGWILLAITLVCLRHLSYMYRIKILSDNVLNWKKSFVLIMLWELASAATPSIVGGSAFAIFLLIKEKISAGKTTTIVLFTGFLDELFFMIVAPLAFLLAGVNDLFPGAVKFSSSPYFYFFFFGYTLLLIYTLFLVYGLFFNPEGLKSIITKIFSIKFLRKWQNEAIKTGDDIVATSHELQHKNFKFWLSTFGATVISWASRFLMVNCMILAFTSVTFSDQFIIFARQIVVWVLMLVTPTPGGSGIGEIAFSDFLIEFVPSGLAGPLALLWRFLSYYPYLIIGIIFLPRWLKRVYSEDNEQKLLT